MTEERAIPKSTVPSLLEAFRAAFDSPFKVERIAYERGKSTFTVERLVPEDSVTPEDLGSEFLTAYQMIRQHSDLEIQEAVDDPLEAVARAVQTLTARGYKLTMFVCEDRNQLRDWIRRDLRVEDIWQVPLIEDPDAHDAGIFVAGSKAGALVREIEAAVFCRIGASRG